MKTHLKIITAGACLLSTPAHAIILYGAGNDTNITDPGTGLPFEIVARVQAAPGQQNGGSGVHLGGGFILTAAHIGTSELASVTFDNSTFYSRDLSYIPVQIGSTDMQIFKLSTVPSVGAAALYEGSAELSNEGYIVGWGRGRVEGSAINTNTVPIAGAGTPLIKRWGTNDPTREINGFTYTFGSTYTFDALETVMGNIGGNPNNNGTGAFEAAATTRDSGSGYFQNIGGTWYLTGLTSLIISQNAGNVTYGNDVAWSGATPSDFSAPAGSGDPNIFVKVSSYSETINQLIPEPSSVLLCILGTPLLLRRKR